MPSNSFAGNPKEHLPHRHIFTNKRWNTSVYNSLLRTTEALDVLCTELVDADKPFKDSTDNGNPVKQGIGELSLTVAVLETSIFSYALYMSRMKAASIAHVANVAAAQTATPLSANTPVTRSASDFIHHPSSRARLNSWQSHTTELDTPPILTHPHAEPGAHGEPPAIQSATTYPVSAISSSNSNAAHRPLYEIKGGTPYTTLSRTGSNKSDGSTFSNTSSRSPDIPSSPSSMVQASQSRNKLRVQLPPFAHASSLSPAMLPVGVVGAHSHRHGHHRRMLSTGGTGSTTSVNSVTSTSTKSSLRSGVNPEVWRHTGGIMVLLDLLTDTLTSTKRCLKSLTADGGQLRRYLMKSKFFLVVSLPLYIGFVLLLKKVLQRFVVERLGKWFMKKLGPMGGALQQMLTSSLEPQLPKLSRALYIAKNVLQYGGFGAVQYYLYRRNVAKRVAMLQMYRQRLVVLLQMWHGCMATLNQDARIPAVYDQSSKKRLPIFKRLLGIVIPTSASPFWYSNSWQLYFLQYGLDVLYCATQRCYSIFGNRKLISAPFFSLCTMYYAFRPALASRYARQIMGSPDVRTLKLAWTLMETKIMRAFTWALFPSLRRKPKLAVCKRIQLVTEGEYKSNADGSRGPTPQPMLSPSMGPEVAPGQASPQVGQLGVHQRRKVSLEGGGFSKNVAVWLLSEKPHNLSSVNPVLPRKKKETQATPGKPIVNLHEVKSPIIIYFHGGGWISRFRGADFDLLSWLAVKTHCPILYVDYSLSPESVYPEAMEECLQVYQWVLAGRLNVRPTRIVLAGDSSGGNLAVGVTQRCITRKLRVPDSLMLAYPVLSFRTRPTPSRFLSMMDPVLPVALQTMARSIYVPSHCDIDVDPLVSPVAAKSEVLSQFPPTSIMIGGFDPLLDDSVDFAHKLIANGVSVRFKVFRELPHAFFNFAHILDKVQVAIDVMCEWVAADLPFMDHDE